MTRDVPATFGERFYGTEGAHKGFRLTPQQYSFCQAPMVFLAHVCAKNPSELPMERMALYATTNRGSPIGGPGEGSAK